LESKAADRGIGKERSFSLQTLLAELPKENCSEKTTAFGVATDPNCVQPCYHTERERKRTVYAISFEYVLTQNAFAALTQHGRRIAQRLGDQIGDSCLLPKSR
jgi:hypothetical protein